MKKAIVGLALLLPACCARQCVHEEMPQVQTAYVTVQTTHYQDGPDVERLMLWADGRWWELFKRTLSPK